MNDSFEGRGPLLLIGGAEDKAGSKTILKRFVELAGGRAARVVIIATASAFHDIVGQRYVTLFTQLGAAQATLLPLNDRAQASSAAVTAQLEAATGIFMTGGDQLKITALLGGTPAARKIREANLRGAVVAGTSAGASVASEHMMAYGASGIAPHKDMMQFAPGLGLISGVVIDQHFGQRGRTGRLITALAHNPDLIGIGLDEDTAIEIQPNGFLTVLGRGSVLVVDAAATTWSDIYTVSDYAPLTMFDLRVHVLSQRYHYDLTTRTPHQPNEPAAPLPTTEGIGGEGI